MQSLPAELQGTVPYSIVHMLQVQHDFNRNYYFNTQEAKEYGIIDNIIKPPRSAMLGV